MNRKGGLRQMDTFSAFARGYANRDKPQKCFDWIKAAQLIKEHRPREASAGLIEDWEWTGGPIYRDGKIIPREETYVYLASTWATPTLIMDGEEYECYFIEGEQPYNHDTHNYWIEEARQIVENDTF